MPMGRPKKYEGKLISSSMALPEPISAMVADQSDATGKSKNEALIMLLMSADKEVAASFSARLTELQALASEMKIHNARLTSAIEAQTARFEKLATTDRISIYAKLEPDALIIETVEENKKRYLDLLRECGSSSQRIEKRDIFVELILNKFTEKAASKGKIITRRNVAKVMVRQALADIEESVTGPIG